MVTVSYQAATDFNEQLEDLVEYFCSEQAKEGQLISGETAYKLMEAFAATKQEEMKGAF